MLRFPYRALTVATLFATGLLACSGAVDSSSDQTDAALSDCSKVTSKPTTTKVDDENGTEKGTQFTIAASGCIASTLDSSELIDDLVAIVNDDTALSKLSGKSGRLFTEFDAHDATGSLTSSSGQVRKIDVTLNADHSPTTTLKITLKKTQSGDLSFALTNTSGIGVLMFNAIDAGGLDVRLTAKHVDGGVTIAGTTKILVNKGYESNVTGVDELPALVIGYLRKQIAAKN